jgi:hypothetical protein
LERILRSFWAGFPGHFEPDFAVIFNWIPWSFWTGLCSEY